MDTTENPGARAGRCHSGGDNPREAEGGELPRAIQNHGKEFPGKGLGMPCPNPDLDETTSELRNSPEGRSMAPSEPKSQFLPKHSKIFAIRQRKSREFPEENPGLGVGCGHFWKGTAAS